MIQKQFSLNIKYDLLGMRFKSLQLSSFKKVVNALFITTFFSLLILSCKSNKSLQTTSYYQPNYQTGADDRRDGLGFQIPDKYPIEILIGNEQPQAQSESIEKLSISDETPIQPDQLYKGRMLKRGNDQQQKKALLDRMVLQAQDLGASGLMNVNYKVFSTAKTTGYTLSGTAFRYVLKK